jgi:hypothetical protein
MDLEAADSQVAHLPGILGGRLGHGIERGISAPRVGHDREQSPGAILQIARCRSHGRPQSRQSFPVDRKAAKAQKSLWTIGRFRRVVTHVPGQAAW